MGLGASTGATMRVAHSMRPMATRARWVFGAALLLSGCGGKTVIEEGDSTLGDTSSDASDARDPGGNSPQANDDETGAGTGGLDRAELGGGGLDGGGGQPQEGCPPSLPSPGACAPDGLFCEYGGFCESVTCLNGIWVFPIC